MSHYKQFLSSDLPIKEVYIMKVKHVLFKT